MPDVSLETPTLDPGRAPGLAAWWPMRPAGGRTLFDLGPSRRFGGSLVGALEWQASPLGPRLGNFAAIGGAVDRYVVLPASPQVVVAAYPCWFVVGLQFPTATASVNLWVWSAGNAAGGNVLVGLRTNDTAYNQLEYFVRNAASTTASAAATGLGTGDGRPHVVGCVSYAANDHRLFVDGVQRAQATTNVGTIAADRLTLGAIGRDTYVNGTTAALWHASMGAGAVPDMAALSARLLRDGLGFAAPPASRTIVLLGGAGAGGGGGPEGPGAATLGGLDASGSGLLAFAGSGAPTLAGLDPSGSGLLAFVGAASAAFAGLDADGSGEAFAKAGSAAASLAGLDASGSGLLAFAGSGSPSLGGLDPSGSGQFGSDVAGSGSPALGGLDASAAGLLAFAGTGSAALGAFDAAGSGSLTTNPAGSGSPSLGGLGAAGSGLRAFAGASAAPLGGLDASGAGTLALLGSGAATLAGPDAAGLAALGEVLAARTVFGVAATPDPGGAFGVISTPH